jgi:putative redox protein
MPSELRIHAVYDGGLRMTATNGQFSVTTDYPVAPGHAVAGFKPMELLLVSLGTCGGSVVGSLLGRMNQPATAVEVEVRGQRRDEHPTVFTSIDVQFVVRGHGVDPAAVAKTIERAEKHLCPVWAMLAHGTPITTSFRIEDEVPATPRL